MHAMGDSRSCSTDARAALALVLAIHALALQWLASTRPALREPAPPRSIQVSLLQPAPLQPSQPISEPPKPRPVAQRPAVPPKPAEPKVMPRHAPTPPPQAPADAVPPQTIVAEATTTPLEPARSEVPQSSPDPVPTAIAAAPATPPPSAPPAPRAFEPVTAPLYNADYLANPAPPYPSLSRRTGEQGKVVLRVFVDPHGVPQRVELRDSSGFDRLDDVALATVKHWKFVPARQGDKSISAWVLIPINFNLRERN